MSVLEKQKILYEAKRKKYQFVPLDSRRTSCCIPPGHLDAEVQLLRGQLVRAGRRQLRQDILPTM